MNDYETIYNDAFKHDYWEKGGTTHTAAYAGIAAVVAAAKAEALEEAATEASMVLGVNEAGLQNADVSGDCYGTVTVHGWLRSYARRIASGWQPSTDCPVSHCRRDSGHVGAHVDKSGGFA